jgi:hypothetical protein
MQFARLDVHGSLNDSSADEVGVFLIRSSSDVSVVDSVFQQLLTGLAHLDNLGLEISGNAFHDNVSTAFMAAVHRVS